MYVFVTHKGPQEREAKLQSNFLFWKKDQRQGSNGVSENQLEASLTYFPAIVFCDYSL
jgi:hypothetical protein